MEYLEIDVLILEAQNALGMVMLLNMTPSSVLYDLTMFKTVQEQGFYTFKYRSEGKITRQELGELAYTCYHLAQNWHGWHGQDPETWQLCQKTQENIYAFLVAHPKHSDNDTYTFQKYDPNA